MGADIYLRSVNNKARDKWQPIFDQAVKDRDAVIANLKATGGDVNWDVNGVANDPILRAAQEKVSEAYEGIYSEGYFRDSYNSSSLLWTLGASWWQLAEELLNKKGELAVSKAKKLLKRFESGDYAFDEAKVREYCLADKDRFTPEGVNKHAGESLDDWIKYYKEKHERWCALLRQSIELKEPLYWSV